MKFFNVTKKFEDDTVFDNLCLEITENKVTVVMGASGVGKSTLAGIMTGLTDYSGTVELNGDISMVFGEPALLPNLTVEKNLEYAIKHKIKGKSERKALIAKALEAVELSADAKKYPYELSTGMSQRVALARAFIYPSEYIVLDEPFRGLDLGVKRRLQRYLKALLFDDLRTTILITHDPEEAVMLADDIVVLRGRPAKVVYSTSVIRGGKDDNTAEVGNKLKDIFNEPAI